MKLFPPKNDIMLKKKRSFFSSFFSLFFGVFRSSAYIFSKLFLLSALHPGNDFFVWKLFSLFLSLLFSPRTVYSKFTFKNICIYAKFFGQKSFSPNSKMAYFQKWNCQILSKESVCECVVLEGAAKVDEQNNINCQIIIFLCAFVFLSIRASTFGRSLFGNVRTLWANTNFQFRIFLLRAV